MSAREFAFTPEVFTLDAAAHYLGVSKRTVEEYVINGKLKTFRLPATAADSKEFLGRTHILRRELERLIGEGLLV